MKEAAAFFKALADEARLQILWLLFNRRELCVCELLAALGTTQSKTSRHLRTPLTAMQLNTEALLTGANVSLEQLALAKTAPDGLGIAPQDGQGEWRTWAGAKLYQVNADTRKSGTPFTTLLVPFAEAGATGSRYKVWLPVAGQPVANLLLDGTESRSRQGNVSGSINDDDPQSLVTTFDGKPAAEDWFAVTLDQPVSARRVVHGGLTIV